MRHFFAAPLAPARLSSGMVEASPKRLLVAVARAAHTRAPRLSGAGRWAIPLAVIAASTYSQLLLTARTIPHSVADDVDRTTSSPKRLDAAGQSRHCRWRDTRNRRSQRRLPEGSRRSVLGPSPFAERARVIAPATARKLCRLGSPNGDDEEKKTKKTNQIHEADGSI
jgi:hypothetical protein